MLKLFILLIPLICTAIPKTPILPPSSPRVLAMGGAYVALADDPQCGFRNPGGLFSFDGIGYDQSFATTTNHGVDDLIFSYVNPSTNKGSKLGTGVWMQGVARPGDYKFYVPYVGTAWSPAGGFNLGLVMRGAFRYARADSIDMSWTTVADLSFLHRGRNLSFGGMLERAAGGEAEMVPRRLRLGAAWVSDSRDLLVAYEWLGEQGLAKYSFLNRSSHLGLEFFASQYVAMRTGYVWDEFHRITFGTAFGDLARGWGVEMSWSLRTAGGGETFYGLGLTYRLK